MLSLRKRAWISGGLSALVSLWRSGPLLLYSYPEQRVAATALTAPWSSGTPRLSWRSAIVSDDPARLGELIFDPDYETPLSGRYWQVDGPDGRDLHLDRRCLMPRCQTLRGGATRLTLHDARTPRMRTSAHTARQVITLEDGSEWSVAVAESLCRPDRRPRAKCAAACLLAFALVAAIGVADRCLLQTAAIVRPAGKAAPRCGAPLGTGRSAEQADYPEEVAPLVGDINTLLQRNREIISRSRRQAADLAHALKTPSAILRNELEALSERAHDMDTRAGCA